MASIREQKDPTASIRELAQFLNSMQVVDLSPLLYTNMPHWHRHPDVFIVEDARNFAQNGYFLQTIILPEHDGCHVDAPAHAHADKAHQTIDTFPVNSLMELLRKSISRKKTTLLATSFL